MQSNFDTLEYTKGAEKIGIKREHAEYQAQQMASLMETTLATKQDITLLKHEIVLLEKNILLKLGVMMGVYSGIIIGVLSYIGAR